MLISDRLELVPLSEVHFDALERDDMPLLGRLLSTQTPKTWTTFDDMKNMLPFFINVCRANGEKWGSYFIIEKNDRQLLGTCGFKGSPDAADEKGMVEIGYEIEESYRGRGLATEAAQCLVNFAFSDARVHGVCAHTLAQVTPSVSVLKKMGFTFAGQYFEPNDGDVWRWELRKEK